MTLPHWLLNSYYFILLDNFFIWGRILVNLHHSLLNQVQNDKNVTLMNRVLKIGKFNIWSLDFAAFY